MATKTVKIEEAKQIRRLARSIMETPEHSALIIKNLFGEQAGAIYWSKMAVAARHIEAECTALDELNAEMKKHAAQIERERAKQERAQAKQQQQQPQP